MTSANRTAAREICHKGYMKERDDIHQRIINLRLLLVRMAAGERTTWNGSEQTNLSTKYENDFRMLKHSMHYYRLLRRRYWEARR